MKIVIDLQGAQTASKYRGIGRYAISIAKAIAKEPRDHEIWITGSSILGISQEELALQLEGSVPLERIRYFTTPANISANVPGSHWRRNAAELIRENFIRELNPDALYISSLFEGGEDDAALSVDRLQKSHTTGATLYDLIPLTSPAKYLGIQWARDWYEEKLRYLLRADTLFSISEYSRQQAFSLLGLNNDRVVNISCACDDKFRPVKLDTSHSQALRQKYGIVDRFILYSGAMDERKNVRRLIEAYCLLPPSVIVSHQLVLVGKYSAGEKQELDRQIAQQGNPNRIKTTGYMPDSDLVPLLALAELFVFPSLQEGFGLPPLEAMACGTPTIAARATSLPEVIGLDEALFDPENVDDMCRSIHRALTDKDFHRLLQEHAVTQARKFSWNRSASVVLDSLEQLNEQALVRNSTQIEWSRTVKASEVRHNELVSSISQAAEVSMCIDRQSLRDVAYSIAENETTVRWANCHQVASANFDWRLEGPFDSTYSLALVNRELAKALSGAGHNVQLHSTEGPGDFLPNADYLERNPSIDRMYQRSKAVSPADVLVTSRNLFPPRVHDVQSRISLIHCYGWEESGFPQEWALAFNEHLQGIGCLSSHVKKILIDNGVTVPLWVAGAGVDHWTSIQPSATFNVSGKGFRFLHVSSCFPRKGADILIRAFAEAFGRDDNVSLIVKTFPNPHNRIHDWIQEARMDHSDFPMVVVIEEDLSDEELKALYLKCDCLVAPSKAEGFGLPLAEAMICGIDVITTRWSGQLDFCNDQTSWLVDYEFERADSHLDIFDSVWAKPSKEHLTAVMKQIFDLPIEERGVRSARGRDLLVSRFSWSDAARRMAEGVSCIARGVSLIKPKVGWVSTWNTRCGIALHSMHLMEQMMDTMEVFAPFAEQITRTDEKFVVRCWDQYSDDDLKSLSHSVENAKIDTLVIQFNFGFFDFQHLNSFIECETSKGRSIVIILHSTQKPPHVGPSKSLEILAPALRLCDRIIVHTAGDMNRLKMLGVEQNAMVFPLGVLDYSPPKIEPARRKEFVIGCYGFFLPHKGIPELVRATHALRVRGHDVKLRLVNAEYPDRVSTDLIASVRSELGGLGMEHHVEIFSDFLPDVESLDLLSACDLIVYPYQATSESASAAVRYGIITEKPVAVTPLRIFDDIISAAHTLPGTSVEDIAAGIEQLMGEIRSGDAKIIQKSIVMKKWIKDHQYSALALRLSNILFALNNSNVIDLH